MQTPLKETLKTEGLMEKRRPGFLVNRIFATWLNEAVRLHEEGIGVADVGDSRQQIVDPARPDVAVEAPLVVLPALEEGREMAEEVEFQERQLVGQSAVDLVVRRPLVGDDVLELAASHVVPVQDRFLG